MRHQEGWLATNYTNFTNKSGISVIRVIRGRPGTLPGFHQLIPGTGA
jgi:hypothetical protein